MGYYSSAWCKDRFAELSQKYTRATGILESLFGWNPDKFVKLLQNGDNLWPIGRDLLRIFDRYVSAFPAATRTTTHLLPYLGLAANICCKKRSIMPKELLTAMGFGSTLIEQAFQGFAGIQIGPMGAAEDFPRSKKGLLPPREKQKVLDELRQKEFDF